MRALAARERAVALSGGERIKPDICFRVSIVGGGRLVLPAPHPYRLVPKSSAQYKYSVSIAYQQEGPWSAGVRVRSAGECCAVLCVRENLKQLVSSVRI
jgi:hypothetical protein